MFLAYRSGPIEPSGGRPWVLADTPLIIGATRGNGTPKSPYAFDVFHGEHHWLVEADRIRLAEPGE